MTPRGPFRWYASCCATALANTPPLLGIPFVGVIVAALADPAPLGPVTARVFTDGRPRGAVGRPRQFGMVPLLWRFVSLSVAGRLAGEHRRSPFVRGGIPIAEPHLLTAEERRAAYAA